MEARLDELDSLFGAQKIDLGIRNLEKQLEELPQPKAIAEVRAKRAALQKKAVQIAALKKDASKRLARTHDEDASLAKKESGVQAAIEAAGGDYRNVEARTKELAGIAKRRSALAENLEQIEAELAKIAGLGAQVAAALQELDSAEAQAIADYRREGGALKQQMAVLEQQRDAILVGIDAQLVEAYRKIADRLGSVAVGELDGNRCSVCRSVIDGGRLIDLRNQAPLGTCPSCTRMLIIRPE